MTDDELAELKNEEENAFVHRWARVIIEGVGGLDNFEFYECAVLHDQPRAAVVIWTLRCLANVENPLANRIWDIIAVERKRRLKRGGIFGFRRSKTKSSSSKKPKRRK